MRTEAEREATRIEDERAGAELARKLRSSGGTCDCPGFPASRQDILRISLKDGRVFERGTIHGWGGLVHMARSPARSPEVRRILREDVERHVARILERCRVENRSVMIYLVERYWGSETLSVSFDEIAKIEVVL